MSRLLGVLIVFLASAGGTVPVAAGPNAGGTLVAQDANLLLSETDGSASLCSQGFVPASCEAIETRIDGATAADPAVFKIYAVFPEGASPRLMGLTWGVHYPPGVVPAQWGMCGTFELNDDTWPASDTGSSVTYTVLQQGHLTAVYWFAAYLYGGPALFTLRDNPSQGGWFGDDSIPAVLDPIAAYGAIGFDMDPDARACPADLGACCALDGTCAATLEAECAAPDFWQGSGTICAPGGCPPVGACCRPDGRCEVTFEVQCAPPDVWRGPGTDCTPNQCPPPPGACCFADGGCRLLSNEECDQAGGTWLGTETPCAPDPCSASGACCHPDATCTITLEAQCTGAWQGPQTECTPNPCPLLLGACCIGLSCGLATEPDCQGEWLGIGTSCAPHPCCRRSAPEHPLPSPHGEARAIGPGRGVVLERPARDAICPGALLKRNDDGSYENGYAWAYGANVPPYFGAWAEGFSLDLESGTVCGMRFGLTQAGTGEGVMDVYVWDADECGPNNVLSTTVGVNPGPVGFWPAVTQHDIDIPDVAVPGRYYVGWWGRWPYSSNPWWIGADENGPGGGLPRTNIAPGIGYPTGWNIPNIVGEFAGCRDLAIGVYEIASPVPVERTSWGRIKSLFR